MTRAIWAYPRDLVERGAETELEELRSLGYTGVSVAAAYHSVQAYLPENPRRRWLTAQRSQLHYRADRSRYGALAPVAGDEDEVFAVAAEAVQTSGLDLIAWLVLCHSSLGTDRRELAIWPLGEAPVPGALCPAQPAVGEYACALAAEVDERFAPAALDLETPGWVTLPHHQHGKIGAELGDGARFAAGLCLCEACKALGAADIAARFRGVGAGIGLDELLDDAEAAAFQQARERVVTSLVAGIAAAVKAKVHVAHWGDPRPAGVDYAALTKAADRLTVLAYAPDPDDVERILMPAIAACGAERIVAGLTLCYPEMPDAVTFRACLERCRALGLTAISVYNHSLVERARLRWAAD
jgi:hypothetical protein